MPTELTEAEVRKMKFPPLANHHFVKNCKHTSLPGLSASSNMFHNHVTIFVERVRDYGFTWSKYTVTVAGDKYGETGDEVALPRGANLKAAKQAAIELAADYARQGLLNR